MTQNQQPKKERKYTLEEARKIISAEAGNASFDARGRTGMREMAKNSWKEPSAKREAFAIIVKALSTYKIARVREITRVGWAKCEGCGKTITLLKRENIVPRDWNKPYDTSVLCTDCLKKHTITPVTDATVEMITAAKQLSTEPKIIVEKALGDSSVQ